MTCASKAGTVNQCKCEVIERGRHSGRPRLISAAALAYTLEPGWFV